MLFRGIYTVILTLLLPFLVFKLWKRGRYNPEYKKRIGERFGRFNLQLEKSIWIHSVSVGETIAISGLVKQLIKQYPDYDFFITTMTPTGSREVKRIYHGYANVYHGYLPYDLPYLLKPVFKKISPHLLIIMETELWPNLLHVSHQNNVPVFLTNARLSEKSYKGYKRIGFMTRSMLKNISMVATQTPNDAGYFQKLGLAENKVKITGNLKFDKQITESDYKKGIALSKEVQNRHVWIGASTHTGEDEILLNAHNSLLKKDPNVLLILVPRHPERFDKVASMAKKQHFSIARQAQGDKITESTNVLIGDTMGELMSYYYASDVAFVGGSLVSHGGHNMLEPASLYKPVLSGPYVFNFEKIAEQLMNANAMQMVQNEQDLTQMVNLLLNNGQQYEFMSGNAAQIIQANQGACYKQFALAQSLLSYD
jgi:3-deoxy-D-manno-octulosonic-acid transferase